MATPGMNVSLFMEKADLCKAFSRSKGPYFVKR